MHLAASQRMDQALACRNDQQVNCYHRNTTACGGLIVPDTAG
jgi:hypothetical protein